MSNFDFTPFESISGYIIKPLSNAMDAMVHGLSTAIAMPLNLASIIFVFLYGYTVMTGRVTLSMHSLLNNVLKIVIVTTMATNADTFNAYVKDIFFRDLAGAIGNAINSNPTDASVLDYILLTVILRYQEILAAAWFFEKIIVGFIGVVMIVAVIFFCIAGFIVQMFAQVALVMVIALGPLFISLYLFNVTKKFTDAWIATLANFTILQVLVIMLGTIMSKIILNVLNEPYTSIYLLFPPVVVISIVGAVLFRALPGLSTALANGGAYFHTASAGGQIFNLVTGGLKAGGNLTKGMFGGKNVASTAATAANAITRGTSGGRSLPF
ncbi:type IV secretion system protein [Bartonella ancashensis]|uniref:Integral inner membrane protein of type IV secretion complex (VirB6) n=1 Tax=Bartonella ancashensis TaxID=1318743 RepID=A0A0M3T2M7_9HYPH|nr:type IV secretion system protein [Bartonella ancashensis]ALE03005.1 Integral inner membrane protein of type IV secretion complex (VirB6) [Bartonella ancashensis]